MDILDMLLSGDPAAAQKRQAALLRGTQNFQDVATGATDQAQNLDLLNFAAANSNNPVLAKSVAAMQAGQQSRYTPQKLDKGIYVPGTGQYAESPGTADEKEADRQMRQLQAASVLQAREDASRQRAAANEATNQTRLMLGQTQKAMTEAQAARLELQRDRTANLVAQQNQNDVRQFGHSLSKQGLPELGSAVSGIHELLAMPEGDMAGIGYGQETLSKIPGLSDITMGPEGKMNRSRVQKLINALMLTEAGKAVTKTEEGRQAIANMNADNYSEADFRNAMKTVILPALENVRSNVVKQTDPNIVDQYIQNDDSGYNPRKSFLPGVGVTKGGLSTDPSIPPMVKDPDTRRPGKSSASTGKYSDAAKEQRYQEYVRTHSQ